MSWKDGKTWEGKPWKIPEQVEEWREPSAVIALREGILTDEFLVKKFEVGKVVTPEPESKITLGSIGEMEEGTLWVVGATWFTFYGLRIAGVLDGREGEREEGVFDSVDFQLTQSFAGWGGELSQVE